jgi:two-component system LytT family response regulator
MKKLITIIIDDEPNAIRSLETILTEYCEGIEIAATANGALEGVKKVNTYHPDLVFLDVDMPGGNGFDFLEAFPDRDFKVIFTTASSDHALKAIKAKAEDYLLKPVDIDELNTALSNLRAVLDTKKSFDRNKIALPTQNGYTYVSYHDIIHIDNEGNYTTFYLKDNTKHLISKNIGYFADLLDFFPFFRCHQSHIINLDEINELNRTDGTHVILSNGNRIDVSRGKKDELYEVMGK